ncbi:MAG: hypothetical protein JSU91_04595 [Thermoplasmatales archaeon]|nr:MAG: hypothetical protein JSU91_04595 [Thermoplasmatales archaeon]
MNKLTWKITLILFDRLWLYQFIHQYVISIFKKKNYPKVFCIGYPKTGTTSLYKALNILGYRAVRIFDTKTWHKKDLRKYISHIKKSKYDAFVDFPISDNILYQDIDKEIPNSKFILTIRDKKSLETSYKNFYKEAPFYEKILKDLEGKLLNLNKRNEEILKYFKNKPSQLLVMNIINGDGWDMLCKFLDKPIPKKKFPHKNIGRYKDKNIT